MFRTDADGNVGNQYVEANPSIGQPPTLISADWLNAVQEELAGMVEASGTTLVKNTNNQLAAALLLLYESQGIEPGGRLTLATSAPIPAADQAGKTTVYYTPHKHDRIKLYDGTRWKWYTFVELSQATTDATKSPAAVTTNSNYDVFVWDDSGTVRATRGPAWSTDTSRGTGAGTTELEYFGGRWVNKNDVTNGPAARRGLYVGSIRSDSSSQINDKAAKRHVWNAYNRARRHMQVIEQTLSWTYSTATWRQVNGQTSNQLDFIVGLDNAVDAIDVRANFAGSSNVNSVSVMGGGIGIDSTTTPSGLTAILDTIPTSGTASGCAAYVSFTPSLGRHYAAWLEIGSGSNTQTWFAGENQGGTTARVQTGIQGSIMA